MRFHDPPTSRQGSPPLAEAQGVSDHSRTGRSERRSETTKSAGSPSADPRVVGPDIGTTRQFSSNVPLSSTAGSDGQAAGCGDWPHRTNFRADMLQHDKLQGDPAFFRVAPIVLPTCCNLLVIREIRNFFGLRRLSCRHATTSWRQGRCGRFSGFAGCRADMRNTNSGMDIRRAQNSDYPADMRNCNEDNDLRHKRNFRWPGGVCARLLWGSWSSRTPTLTRPSGDLSRGER